MKITHRVRNEFLKLQKNLRHNSNNSFNYSDLKKFQNVLDRSNDVLVLTGKEVSAETIKFSQFKRKPKWRNHSIDTLINFKTFEKNPSLIWEFYNYKRHLAFNTNPNQVHITLADLERKFKRENKELTILTENIDGLHIRAGSQNVLELLGALRKVECTNNNCKNIETVYDDPIVPAFENRIDPKLNKADLIPIERDLLPKCKKCKSLARPHTTWFDERMDTDLLFKAHHLILVVDMIIVIGSCNQMHPGSFLTSHAAKKGIPVAEFSKNKYPSCKNFMFHFSGLCEQTFPKILMVQKVDSQNKSENFN